MNKEKWYLCLSRMPKKRGTKVHTLSSNSAPRKGMRIQIIGVFKSSSVVRKVRRKLGDKFLISQWGTMFQADERNLFINPNQSERY